ncbi:MAG: PHA/PHB synthase family protein, partial [Sphingomonadaceae bacterium]
MKLNDVKVEKGAGAAANQPACYLEQPGGANPLDLALQSAMAKITMGVSPIAMSLAFQDWLLHLATSPGKQLELAQLLTQLTTDIAPIDPARREGESRFAAPGWEQWPFSAMSHSFMQAEQFWRQATSGVRGVAPHHADVVNFTARQLLDLAAPSNYFLTNPEVLRTAVETGGQSVLKGWANWLQDMAGRKPAAADEQSAYQVGRNVAMTPGKVVYRNELIELIQYAPQTPQVYREPLLIVPSWIMKYYILDLSPHNSMVRYLVEQGHTVFLVSWRNPVAADRDLGMDDYLKHGVFDAVAEVDRITGQPVHGIGYCLGGTLLSMAAAVYGAQRDGYAGKLKSVSLLAAQTDFSEPGELGLFIDDSELAFLDAMMWQHGYLDGSQMAGSFQLLNSRDLVWSRIMQEYLMGKRSVPNDLMAWNADTTRMPYRMHSEYLKRLFLHNDLAEGRYCVDGKAVALTDIKAPLYVVGTGRDHVSPWKSVYKIHLSASGPVDFVLASGGHNAGIVSEPGHAKRSFKYIRRLASTLSSLNSPLALILPMIACSKSWSIIDRAESIFSKKI